MPTQEETLATVLGALDAQQQQLVQIREIMVDLLGDKAAPKLKQSQNQLFKLDDIQAYYPSIKLSKYTNFRKVPRTIAYAPTDDNGKVNKNAPCIKNNTAYYEFVLDPSVKVGDGQYKFMTKKGGYFIRVMGVARNEMLIYRRVYKAHDSKKSFAQPLPGINDDYKITDELYKYLVKIFSENFGSRFLAMDSLAKYTGLHIRKVQRIRAAWTNMERQKNKGIAVQRGQS